MDIAHVGPACVVVDQHDPIRVVGKFDSPASIVAEYRVQNPRRPFRNRCDRNRNETPVYSVVPEAVINAGAFRFHGIVADVENCIVIDIGIECQFCVLQCA